MKQRSEPIVPDAVEERLCCEPDIEFSLAFGSRVSGTPRQSSDLDLDNLPR